MNNVRVDDKLPMFKRHLYDVMDDAIREVSRDILIKSRMKAPLKHGHLRGESVTHRIAPRHHSVEYTIEYAGAQEAGETRGYPITHYTTAGTGAHFLEDTGDKYVKMSLAGKWQKHATRARV